MAAAINCCALVVSLMVCTTLFVCVETDYRLEVLFLRLDNPTGRCGDPRCAAKQGCCDHPPFSNSTQSCAGQCGYHPRFCVRPLGTMSNSSLDCLHKINLTNKIFGGDFRFFDANNSFFNSSNPAIFTGSRWLGGIQLFMEVYDADDGLDVELVDRFAVDVNVSVGSNITLNTTGVFGLMKLRVNFRVMCVENFFVLDCATCSGANRDPSTNCSTCLAGYGGSDCTVDFDRCGHTTPCENGATCNNTGPDQYECLCAAGFEGVNCTIDLDRCGHTTPCENGTTCNNTGPDQFECLCAAGFEGVNCERETDECDPNPCVNGGTCTDLLAGYNCSCFAGFSGTNCDQEEATVFCEAETTEFLSWPNTSAGTTASFQCPSSTTIISRTCSSSGVWETVDLSLCTIFSSINIENITLGNYEEVLTNISGAVTGAAINEEQQTTNNLAIVAAAYLRSAALISETTIISNTVVQDLVNTLEGLQQWNEDVLQSNASSIVHSFEVLVSVFARQLEVGDRISFMTENVLFVAELLPYMELAANGRNFSSGGRQTGNVTLNETAAVFLPNSLFQLITNQSSVANFFAVYSTGVLFPIRNATKLVQRTNASVTTVVGSPVLAVSVGPGLNFSGLVEPVRIKLQLNELENVTNQTRRCVSWDFDYEEWTTEGCETEVDEGVVTCSCNHLTNFAILVDICSRFQDDCLPSGPIQTALTVLTIVGAVFSLVGIAATIFTLLVFKKLREQDVTIFHIQLCIALFCMLIVFVCGIDQTSVYGGCVFVSVLIHYFTLVAVMFMGAEAVLLFQKLIIVFGQTTVKFFISVSFICWLVPIIPVVIPMAVDLSDTVSRDLLVRRPTEENGQGFCFISDPAVFFGAFLGPIFAILLFNIVIFVLVIGVIIKQTRYTLDYNKEQIDMKTTIRLLIGIGKVMFLFGLTWLFGALTVTGFGSAAASTAFQVLFVLCNAFQGFFIFLFFCVLSKEGRESWLELLSCGRYKSKSLHPSQTKNSSSGATATQKKFISSSTRLTDSNLNSAISSKTGYNSSIDDKERYTDIPLTSVADQEKKPSVVTSSNHPQIHDTNVSTDKKVDLGSSEVKQKEQERSRNCEDHASSHQWREDGKELKVRLKRFSTKKAYKHHVEIAEVDLSDSDSDGSYVTNA